MTDEFVCDDTETELVREATPGERDAVDLPGVLRAVDLGGGMVVVFTGSFQVLRRVERCQHCGLIGGH